MARSGDIKDCYLITEERRCVGPLTVGDLRARLAGAPNAYLVLRAGFSPVRLQDREGLELLLTQASRAAPEAPHSQIPHDGRDIFSGHYWFDTEATQEYAHHKAWFEAHRIHGQMRGHEKAQEPRVPLSEEHSRTGNLAQPSKRRKRYLMVGATLGTFGSLALISIAGLLGGSSFLKLPSWLEASSGQRTYEAGDFSSALILMSADGGKDRSAVGAPTRAVAPSMSARSNSAMGPLATAVQWRLLGDPKAFAWALLDLVPYHAQLEPDILPSPDTVVAWALAYLDDSQRIGHPTWEPLLRLVGSAASNRGIAGLAFTHRQIYDIVTALSGLNRSESVAWPASLAGAQRAALLEDPATVYWGNLGRYGRSTVQVREGASQALHLMAQLPFRAQEAEDDPILAKTLLARSASGMLNLAIGLDKAQLARNVETFLPNLQPFLFAHDAAMLRQLFAESQRKYTPSDVSPRVAARVALIARLQADFKILCAREHSALISDFMLQTLRMAWLSEYPLPDPQTLLQQCWVRPPVQGTGDFGDSLPLSALLRPGPVGYVDESIEAERWRNITTAVVGDLALQGRSNKRVTPDGVLGAGSVPARTLSPWVALWLLGMRDDEGRRQTARAFEASFASCQRSDEKNAQPDLLCLGLAWAGCPPDDVAMRLKLLQRVEQVYGLGAAQEAYFQWLTSLYASSTKVAGLPLLPSLLETRFGTHRYVNGIKHPVRALEWLAKGRTVAQPQSGPHLIEEVRGR